MLPADRDMDIMLRIIDDANIIRQRIEYFAMTRESFCDDHSFEGELAYDAVMNPVYRVAEDAIHLSDRVQDACPSVAWKNIRGFRNFVAHGYAEIDRAIAWKVVIEDIPSLAASLSDLISSDND